MNPQKYDPILIGITKDGQWLYVDDAAQIKNDTWRQSRVHAVLSPDAMDHGVWLDRDGCLKKVSVDVVFPVLHGMYGEDAALFRDFWKWRDCPMSAGCPGIRDIYG